jgi:Flp pilus assembly protein TadB
MTDFQIQIPIPLAAAAAAAYAAWLLWILIVRRRVLADRDATTTEGMLRQGSTGEKYLAAAPLADLLTDAGLKIPPIAFNLIQLGCAAAGFLATSMFTLPLPIRVVTVAAGWAAPRAWLSERRRARERSIDDDLPAALSGLSAHLAISSELGQALQAAADAISPPGEAAPKLLAALLRKTAAEIGTGGAAESALHTLQQDSPSPTLAMIAFNLRLYATAGGAKFKRQMIDTAARVRSLLEGRKRARAYAAGARSVVLLIVGLTVVMFVLAFQDPAFAAYYQSSRGTIALLIVGAVMAGSWWIMQRLIDEVG